MQLLSSAVCLALTGIFGWFLWHQLHPTPSGNETAAPSVASSAPVTVAPAADVAPKVVPNGGKRYWFTTGAEGFSPADQLVLSGAGIEIGGKTFAPTEARPLAPEELRNVASQMFVQSTPQSAGFLAKLHIPFSDQSINGNRICDGDIGWVTILKGTTSDHSTVRAGEHGVALGFFTGDSQPDLTSPNPTAMCPAAWYETAENARSTTAPEGGMIPMPAIHNSPDVHCTDLTPCTDQEFLSVVEGMKKQWDLTPDWVRKQCVNNDTFSALENCILHTTVRWLNQHPDAKAPWVDIDTLTSAAK